jgi:cobalamin-dependent methionine synthase I
MSSEHQRTTVGRLTLATVMGVLHDLAVIAVAIVLCLSAAGAITLK